MTTPLTDAIAQFEKATSQDASTAEHITLLGRNPPIKAVTDANNALSSLSACKHLSLSSNAIDRISLPSMPSLEILSLGRNAIKRLDWIESVAPNLQQLWISYNSLDRLNGIENCTHLRVLYASNNKIKDWDEIDKLKELPDLQQLLLLGNPIAADPSYREEVLRRLPKLKKLDGEMV